MPASVINLALSVIEVGTGLTLEGSVLSVTGGQQVANNVTAPSGDTLTLAGNGGAGASIVLGIGDTVTINGALQGLRVRVNNQAGGYTITSSDYYVGYTGAGGQTFTLPAVASNVNRVFVIKNRGTGNLTLAAGGSDQLFSTTNASSFVLVPGVAATVICDGTYWVIVALASGVVTDS